MKRILFFLPVAIGIFLPGLLMAQKNSKGATGSPFTERTRPNHCGLVKVVSQPYGLKVKNVVIYTDSVNSNTYVYLFPGPDTNKIVVDTLTPGLFGTPKIIAVFYANADSDLAKELVILYSIGTRWPEGEMYTYGQQNMIRIYDECMINAEYTSVKALPEPAEKLSAAWTSRYKQKAYNAADMKKLMKAEGF
jgi:hypothetical protein